MTTTANMTMEQMRNTPCPAGSESSRQGAELTLKTAMLPFFAALALLVGCRERPTAETEPAKAVSVEKIHPLSKKDYSFGFWPNGWRKNEDDASADLLCFETGHYGFALDLAAMDKPGFSFFNDGLDYAGALESGISRLNGLAKAGLHVELEHGGKIYRMLACKAATAARPRHLSTVRLWESGKLVQHFDVRELVLESSGGERLSCFGSLDLVAWLNSLTFTVELAPSPVYANGPHHGVVGNGLCVIDKPLDMPHEDKPDTENFTVESWVKIPASLTEDHQGWMLCKNHHEMQDANYGFFMRGNGPGATRHAGATLNVGGGRENQHDLRSKQAFAPDSWNHLALSYDGNEARFHLNGRLQDSKLIGKKRTPGNGPLRIGQRADGHGKPVKGLYDQVRVWNRALSDAEIAGHASKTGEIPDSNGLLYVENFDQPGAAPVQDPSWTDASLRASFKGMGRSWQQDIAVPGIWKSGETRKITLNCDFRKISPTLADISVQITTPEGQSFPVTTDKEKNCYLGTIKKLKRAWKTGYTDIRDYDDFIITVDNKSTVEDTVPLLVDLEPANITGLCPILCDANGNPTGLPVQLSKNWHYEALGAYLRAYMLVPARPGINRYMLRVVYGFDGTLWPNSPFTPITRFSKTLLRAATMWTSFTVLVTRSRPSSSIWEMRALFLCQPNCSPGMARSSSRKPSGASNWRPDAPSSAASPSVSTKRRPTELTPYITCLKEELINEYDIA